MTASSPARPHAEVLGPEVSLIVTEDDTPVDNIPSEKQQRLLTDALFTSWEGPPPEEGGGPRTFLATAKVGLFITPKEPPLVPDVMVSLDVVPHPDLWAKEHRSYFVWEFGKVPDLVIEVVSNREGDELGKKRARYARMRVQNYVVWDPSGMLGGAPLRAFELRGHLYAQMKHAFFDELGLGLTEWDGAYEGCTDRWIRWSRPDGALLLTGRERADTAEQRADTAEQRADTAEQRAEHLAEKLRVLGIDPDAA